MAIACPAAGASDDAETQFDDRSRRRAEEALYRLRNGSSEERLEAARQVSDILGLIAVEAHDPSRAIDDRVKDLILALQQETDDWIARTLLDSLLFNRHPAVNRLFHESLRSASVNLQAVSVLYFVYRKDPEAIQALESLWERNLPSWVRPRLVEALAAQGSATHLDDFMRLTRDDDPEAREAAIEALDTLARPESIPVLVRLSRAGALPDRAEAVKALGAFPDSEEALQEVLQASRSEEPSIRWAAVESLGRLRGPEADGRLIALLEASPDPSLRAGIVEALEDSTAPDTTAALVRLLHEPDVSQGSWIASTAVRVLRNRDDPDAAAGLSDLARNPGEGVREGITGLIDYLRRDRSDGRRSLSILTHCSSGSVTSPQDPRAWHVTPLPPFETIRCWDEPERSGNPKYRRRIPAGTIVLITDHFERPARHWVEIDGEGASGCWVLQDDLEQGAAPSRTLSWPRFIIRHEFDIATADLETLRAGRLIEAGLLDVFEPDDEVAGVALTLDASDPEQVDLVRALLSSERTVLDDAFRIVLREADPGATAYLREDREDGLSGDDDESDVDDDSDDDETID